MLKSIFLNKFKNYLDLIRFSKPIGFLLLMWPSWFSLSIIKLEFSSFIFWLTLFFFGSFFMRSAGCIINDIIDMEIDKKINRTENRPLASKNVSLFEAIFLLFILLSISFIILMQFDFFSIIVGLFSIPLVIIYPFMKRITYWPQIILGILFSWSIIIVNVQFSESITINFILLFIGCVIWTVGYDTIYAYQDREDDIKNNIKSTAVLLGEKGKGFVRINYSSMILIIAYLSWKSNENLISLGVIIAILIGINVIINKWKLNSAQSSNYYFRQNNLFGGFIFSYLFFI